MRELEKLEVFEEFYRSVEKVDYEFSACFNCKYDKWVRGYTEEGLGDWEQYCEVTGWRFGDGEFPKECPFFEECEKR